MKNREKMVLKTMCFFDIDFSSFFFDFSRFLFDFGRPRRLKKSIKIEKIAFRTVLERVWDPVSILDMILERFWWILERFWWILEGFWMDFGRILGRFLEGFDLTNDD